MLQSSEQKSEADVLALHSSSAGGSYSFVGDNKTKQWSRKVGTSWKTKWHTLPHLLTFTDIPVSNETFF